MRKAIYYRLVILTLVAVSVCGLVGAVMYAVRLQNQTKAWLTTLTFATAENYRHNTDIAALARSVGDNRITLISPDGIVLADSRADAAEMENHANREEVKNAQREHVTIAMRKSAIMGQRAMYASLKMEDGNILRIAHSYSGVMSNLIVQVPASLTAIVVSLVLSLFLVGRFSTTVTRPFEKIVDVTVEKKMEQQKRDFFSNASHELKTPVTSIVGFTEMLNKGMVTGEDEKAVILNRLETEAKRLSGLIKDILTISMLESSNVPTECTEFNFADVVREAVGAVSSVKDGTAIDISMDLEDVPYRADKRQIYDLCVNLIENAVKYNKPHGKVNVRVAAASGAGDAQHVVLTVQDTGIGIPPEDQARVFERFFRVDSGRDKKVGGTGLGLAIVKHIVSHYGGKITLQSKKDIGTTITVVL